MGLEILIRGIVFVGIIWLRVEKRDVFIVVIVVRGIMGVIFNFCVNEFIWLCFRYMVFVDLRYV